MCGIAGIFAYHYASPPVEREELRKIRDQMTRRGPDGFGEWFSRDGRVGLGHRRLAIIDLSERGAQPMKSPGGKWIVTFNGEIYNYKELRKDLEAKGVSFQSDSDTEVLLRLYELEGEAMVRKLRGMFAFGIWDEEKKSLFLARDPYGIKPLYYADDGWTVRFASQVKALLAGGKVSRTREPAGEVSFFLTGWIEEPFTLYQEIRSLPAGSFAWVTATGAHEPKKYFSLAQVFSEAEGKRHSLSHEELIGDFKKAMLESVRYHFVSDVPVGIFLSAGIDSGALVGLAADAGIKDVLAITQTFQEFEGTFRDELPLAKEVALHYGARHVVQKISIQEIKKQIPRFLQAMDQPSIDGLNSYMISKAMSEQGLKVALNGLGGDELLGGYPSFHDIPIASRALALPSSIPFLGKAVRSLVKNTLHPTDSKGLKTSALLEYGGRWESLYYLRRAIFLRDELSSILGKELVREGLSRLMLFRILRSYLLPDISSFPQKSSSSFPHVFRRESDPRLRACGDDELLIRGNDELKSHHAKVACLEGSSYMRSQLLRDADWASMAHSLELRTPFVDAWLLRALAPALISLNLSRGRGKQYLAASPSRPLPKKIVSKPKTGFTPPMDEWVKSQGLDDWREAPALCVRNCSWTRRWAYVVYKRFSES